MSQGGTFSTLLLGVVAAQRGGERLPRRGRQPGRCLAGGCCPCRAAPPQPREPFGEAAGAELSAELSAEQRPARGGSAEPAPPRRQPRAGRAAGRALGTAESGCSSARCCPGAGGGHRGRVGSQGSPRMGASARLAQVNPGASGAGRRGWMEPLAHRRDSLAFPSGGTQRAARCLAFVSPSNREVRGTPHSLKPPEGWRRRPGKSIFLS